MKVALALALPARRSPAACADPDGSRPRLSADAPATGFDGGYAGTNGGSGDLDGRSAPV